MPSDSTFASLAAPVRVAVFGASGGVGRLVTEQALGRGHEVVAYVRSAAKLGLAHERPRVVAGELTNREAIGEVVRDADAVISAVGPSLDRKASGMPLVDRTRHVIDAMQATGVRRYVGMATPSLRDRRDRRSVIGAIVPVMGRVLLPRAYRELMAMSQIVIDSDLDWTIARFSRPTNKPATGSVRAGFLGVDKVGMAISRTDIATFLLDQVTDTRFLRAAPAISN
jgi:putative NADH-flavin reductase